MSSEIECVSCGKGIIEYVIVYDHVHEVKASEDGIEIGDKIDEQGDKRQSGFFCNHCNTGYTRREVELMVENPEELGTII